MLWSLCVHSFLWHLFHPGENPQALQSLIWGGRCMEMIQVGRHADMTLFRQADRERARRKQQAASLPRRNGFLRSSFSAVRYFSIGWLMMHRGFCDELNNSWGLRNAACISMGVTEAMRATRGEDDEWDEQDDEALVGGREKICDVVPCSGGVGGSRGHQRYCWLHFTHIYIYVYIYWYNVQLYDWPGTSGLELTSHPPIPVTLQMLKRRLHRT